MGFTLSAISDSYESQVASHTLLLGGESVFQGEVTAQRLPHSWRQSTTRFGDLRLHRLGFHSSKWARSMMLIPVHGAISSIGSCSGRLQAVLFVPRAMDPLFITESAGASRRITGSASRFTNVLNLGYFPMYGPVRLVTPAIWPVRWAQVPKFVQVDRLPNSWPDERSMNSMIYGLPSLGRRRASVASRVQT